jgi:Cu(I)/Ag(I) efflux system membrane protein CusA/SilA
MWSTSTGSEVMKPLATPVLGGMVSSLAHVLLVTRSSSTGFASASCAARGRRSSTISAGAEHE